MMEKNVVITGLGLIGDFGVGKSDFCNFFLHKTAEKKIQDFNINHYIDMTLLRRADDNSCFAAVAAKLAIEDAHLSTEEIPAQKWGLVLGTTHGPLGYTVKYHRELVQGGPRMVSPMLFSNSVLNAAASYISNIFHICGWTATLTGYNAVGQAVQCGADLITERIVDVCLVGGVDIFNDIMNEGYSHCLDNVSHLGDRFGGSGILVLESSESARKRNIEEYAQVLGSEIITADYSQSVKYNISPIRRLLSKLGYKLNDINCVLTSCYNNKENRKRQDLYLKSLKEDTPVVDCSSLFGYTFSAGEIFKVILGILSLKGVFSLPEIYPISSEDWPPGNILVASVTKMDSNACLLLKEIVNKGTGREMIMNSS